MQNIVKYSKIVLNNSIKGGSSIRNFVNTSGDYGGFRNILKFMKEKVKMR